MRSIAHLACWLCSISGFSPAFSQTTWFVDASAVPPGNGSPGSPYVSIQFAHDQASTLSGDTLSIASGDYFGPLFFDEGKALTLAGAGVDQTRVIGELRVLAAPGVTRVRDMTFRRPLRIHESAVELDRLHLVDLPNTIGEPAILLENSPSTWTDVTVSASKVGSARLFNGQHTLLDCSFLDATGPNVSFAAVNTNLSMTNCRFIDNEHASFGALHLSNSSASLVDCEFTGNRSGMNGGAILQSNGQLSVHGGRFAFNESVRGGALFLGGQAALDGVTFEGNVARRDAQSAGTAAIGGAIVTGAAAILTAVGCSFLGNSASGDSPFYLHDHCGGAIFTGAPGSTVTGSVFSDNFASQEASAVYGPLKLVQCLVRDGKGTQFGGALYGALLDRCSVVSNATTPGMACLVDTTITGSIVWGNEGNQLGGTSSATYSCIQGGAVGVGNISADPLFADLGNDDVSLLLGSPCIDAGAPTAPLDADLTPADMGALPFTWQPIGASYCSTHPNSSGQTAAIAALGSASVADDFLRVQATQTALNQVGLFMISQNQGFVPLFNGSQGNLCVSAPIFRLTNTPGSVSSTGSQGLLNLRVGLTTLPAGLQVLPGQTWHFQAWFRDSVAGNSTSNTSDAVSVPFR